MAPFFHGIIVFTLNTIIFLISWKFIIAVMSNKCFSSQSKLIS